MHSPDTPTSSIEQAADRLVDSLAEHVPESIRTPMRTPLAKRIIGIVWRLALIAYFLFAIVILVMRYWIIPEVANYRSDVERTLTTTLQRQVDIGELEAHWVGLRPAVRLRNLVVHDKDNREALWVEQVDALLAWDSFLVGQVYKTKLASLEITAPRLNMQRDASGRLWVAGVEIGPEPGSDDGEFADWLFDQDRIIVHNAQLTWQDDLRKAPALVVPDLNFRLESRGKRHRFGITSTHLQPISGNIDLRGEVFGDDLAQPELWRGQIYLALDEVDLTRMKPWIDPPAQLSQGKGALRMWLEFQNKAVSSLNLDMRFKDMAGQLSPGVAPLALRDLSGRVRVTNYPQSTTVTTDKLTLVTTDGQQLAPVTMDVRIDKDANRGQRGEVSLNELDIGVFASVASHVPLPGDTATQLVKFSPRGRLSDVRVSWNSHDDHLERWNVSGRFEKLGLNALGPVPGVSNISGRVLGDQDRGRLTIDTRNAELALTTVFPEPALQFDKLEGVLEWDKSRQPDAGPIISLRRLSFENRDAAGTSSGTWHTRSGSTAGDIDLTAQLTRADGTAVWRYLPTNLSAGTREWLRTSIKAGQVTGTTLTLKGDLDQFPFRDPKQGQFEVKGQIRGAELDFSDGWPVITELDGDLLFQGQRMLITARGAQSLGARLANVRAEIADLGADKTLLTIDGEASGATSNFLHYVEASPVSAMIDHVTTPMRASGRGALDLKLKLPLDNLEKSQIAGQFRVENNELLVDTALPPIKNVTGQLSFTESSLSAKNLVGNFLGGPVKADIKTEKSIITLATSGEIKLADLHDMKPPKGPGLLTHLAGTAKWQGTISTGSKGTSMAFSSDLIGLSSNLPPPFGKNANDAAPSRFERKPMPIKAAPSPKSGASAKMNKLPAPTEETLDVAIGKQIRAQWIQPLGVGDSASRPTRGALTIGRAPLKLPERNFQVSIDLPEFDMDYWLPLLTSTTDANDVAPSRPTAAQPPTMFDVHADKLIVSDREFADVRASGRRTVDTNGYGLTRMDVRSTAIAGTVEYQEQGIGRLSGALSTLAIPEARKSTGKEGSERPTAPASYTQLPAIELAIDHLSYNRQDLGRLTFGAVSRGGMWDASLALRNPDAELSGTIKWADDAVANAARLTQTDLHLDAKNLEGFMDRIGFPGSLRRGSAQAQCKLSWNGPPSDINYSTLGGSFSIDAKDGQFNKLEPGVGRLLGMLSLQSLPRRITLDFRDIFSKGFAFDSITGDFAVTKGVMAVDNLDVRGPAAKVLMRGTVDLGRETQNLTVRIQPALGDSIAVGAMLASPIVGAVAWATQKILSDPIDRAFAYDYTVSGSWSDPKVEKTSTPPKPPIPHVGAQ